MKINIMSLLIILNISVCHSQNQPGFKYKTPRFGVQQKVAAPLPGIPTSAYNLVNALPPGYSTNGAVDYTLYLQKALDTHTDVVMPNFPVMINENGLSLKSGTNLWFKESSKIILKPNALTKYNILKIHRANNVNVYNPVIVGDRKLHTGITGEWGMGISIRAASNVAIVNPNISECWGDGIYIGQIGTDGCKDVVIYNARLDYNRRNGISVIDVDGLKILNPVITNTFGTSPMASIDIEPNNNTNVINNVQIENPYTFNSKNGMLLVLGKLAGEARKNVNININNHVDDGSYTGLYISGFNKPKDGLPLDGTINISRPVWKNNVQPFRKKKQYEFAPNIVFNNISIIKDSANGGQRLLPDSVSKIKGLFNLNKRIKFN